MTRGAHWRGLIAAALLALAAVPAVAQQSSELRDAMGDFLTSLAVLLQASTQDPPGATAARREAINDALRVMEDHASAMVQHLERDDVAFMAAALEKQIQVLRFAARSGNTAAFHRSLDRSIGSCVGCHARTSEASGTRLATRLLPPELEAKLPTLRRARLQVATRRFEAARETLESGIAGMQGTAQMDALEVYLALMIRILREPAAALAQVKAVAATAGGSGVLLSSWRASLEHWLRRSDGEPQLPRALEALNRAGAQADPEAGRVDYLVAVNEAERWLDRGVGTDADAARAYLVLGTGEHRLNSDATLPMPELYLEQAIWLAPASETARSALAVLEEVLVQRFSGDGMPMEVSDHLRALRRVAG